MTGGNVW